MKRILLAVMALTLCAAAAPAQDAAKLFNEKFSYDLKQDKVSAVFDGKTFWLRASVFKQDTLFLTMYLKGEGPTTASEVITIILSAPDVKLVDLASQILASVKPKTATAPEVVIFDQFQGGQQRVLSYLIQDKSNNLVEDSVVKMTQLDGGRVMTVAHAVRLKYSEVVKNPEAAIEKIGERHDARLRSVTYFTFPF